MDSVVLANWKLNGNLDQLKTFATQIKDRLFKVKVAVCLPFVYLPEAAYQFAGSAIDWAAQDVSQHCEGAFSGEVSAGMLAEFGCAYALIGHSERRQYHQETDQQILAKAEQLVVFGIRPVCCIGEDAQQREDNQARQVIEEQLRLLLQADKALLEQLIIAYEPIWAIGAGQSARPEQAEQMHQFIRQCLHQRGVDVPILYGGSVNQTNAAELSQMANINGFLVGGASLQAASFSQICEVF